MHLISGLHLHISLTHIGAGFCMQLAAHPRADGRRSMTASMAAPPSQREVERSVLVDSFDMDGKTSLSSFLSQCSSRKAPPQQEKKSRD